jgi:hypothetical protein
MREKKKCKMNECNAIHYSRGYCRNHYNFLLRYNLPPTPENVNMINEKRKVKISEKMTKIKPKINLHKFEQLKEDGRIEILPFIIFFELELEEMKKEIKLKEKNERRSIRKIINLLKKEIGEIKQFINKKEVSKEEVKLFVQRLEIKYVAERNEKYIQMKI